MQNKSGALETPMRDYYMRASRIMANTSSFSCASRERYLEKLNDEKKQAEGLLGIYPIKLSTNQNLTQKEHDLYHHITTKILTPDF